MSSWSDESSRLRWLRLPLDDDDDRGATSAGNSRWGHEAADGEFAEERSGVKRNRITTAAWNKTNINHRMPAAACCHECPSVRWTKCHLGVVAAPLRKAAAAADEAVTFSWLALRCVASVSRRRRLRSSV